MANPRFGVGFRTPHLGELLVAERPPEWLELVTENFLGKGGAHRALLARVCERAPVALHGVSLSIAGTDPLDEDYLLELRALADAVRPEFVSDHLAWTGLGGSESHDLLPVALTREVLDHVAARVARVQDALGRRILLENATVYVAFRADEMSEAELLRALCERTGCGVLLDVNNLYVNSENLGVDPRAYLAALPRAGVGYMHLAGHARLADVRIDTHDADVPDPVWDLYAAAVRRFPDAGAIVERDDKLPPFADLCREAEAAQLWHAHERLHACDEPVRGPAAVGLRPHGSESWHDLQCALWSRIVDEPAAAVEPLFADDRPVRAARGLRVYGDAYGENLRRALATNFPALARVLSASEFADLAAAYVRAHPPCGRDYVGLGAELAGFLQTHPEPSALADLAALEQAQLEVQDAPDETARVPPEALAAIPAEKWPGARFVFARALRLVRTAHDVLPVVRGESAARPRREEVCYRVERRMSGVHAERLNALDAALLEALAAGESFADACASRGEPECAQTAAALLLRASSLGLLAALQL